MKRIELRRQSFHAIIGVSFAILIATSIIERIGSIFPFTLIDFMPPIARFMLFILILSGIIVLAIQKTKTKKVDWILEKFEREKVRETFPGKGVYFYALGVFLISLIVQETEIISASVIIVSVGDSVSHLVGEKYGKIKHPLSQDKNIEGNITGALLGGIGASFLINPVLAFGASFISMLWEGIQFRGKLKEILEDNLTIPIISTVTIIILKSIIL